ncbi:MAG: SCO family protein [Solirubrobacteraceae bacterium]
MSDAQRFHLSARGWPLRARATALIATACVAAGAAGSLALNGSDARRARATPPAVVPSGELRGDAVWPPGRRPAPAFTLRDQSGRAVSLSDQRGRAVLLAFMDSHCTRICTLEGPALRNVQRRVGAARLALLVVSVNPWQDTAASSIEAATRWGLRGDWHWLRGSPARLQPIWRAYDIEVARTAGDVAHSAAIYLIDGRGYERAGFNCPFPAGDVVRDLRRLARPAAST